MNKKTCDWIRCADGLLIYLYPVFFVLFEPFVDYAFFIMHMRNISL